METIYTCSGKMASTTPYRTEVAKQLFGDVTARESGLPP
jgi:hypothetical protein